MSKQPPWKIQVGRKQEIIAEFTVPAHRLGQNDLEAFLRAMVVRYRTDEPQEMVGFYINKRRGNPTRRSDADVRYFLDPDQRRNGYFCGTLECYASATQEIDESTALGLKKIREQNRKASSK